MDFPAHQLAERPVDELMARKTPLALKLTGNDAGGKVGIVVRFDADVGARQTGADQIGNFVRGHAALGTSEMGLEV